jgi:hypothetical protein
VNTWQIHQIAEVITCSCGRDDESKVCLHHLLVCLAWRFCLICTILRNSPILSPVSPTTTCISWRQCSPPPRCHSAR